MAGSRVHFLGNACHVCKSKETPCPCEVCRMIFYCSPDHRREDWRQHSEICWAVNKISGTGHLYELSRGRDFTQFRHEVANKCRELLRRNLNPWELEMIYYTRVCNVCREFDWRKLESCKGCQFVYTCDKRHFREDHLKWCKTLKTYSDVIIHQSKVKSNPLTPKEIKHQIYQSMGEVLSVNFDQSSEVEKALLSELLTYPLTVLHGLNRINVLDKRQIEVLFIGAEIQAEVEPMNKWEKYLLHSLEKTEILSLKFLGPELHATPGESQEDLCNDCRDRGKSLKWEFITGKFYHEYKRRKQPDLICAFNSGMYRDFGFGGENSWEATILELFARGRTPVLITEYTLRELKMVAERINALCEEVSPVVNPEMNPFAGMKPGLNIISEEESPDSRFHEEKEEEEEEGIN